MPKYRPDADVAQSDTSVSGSVTRYGAVNEATASDSEYVRSVDGSTLGAYFQVGLTVPDPHSRATHTLRIRHKQESAGLSDIFLYLKSGSTNIMTWSLDYASSYTTVEKVLSSAQVDALINAGYADLSVRVSLPNDGTTNSFVSWIEFETPDNPDSGMELGIVF